MRIVIITPFYLPDPGGISMHVHKLAEQLIKKGNEVTIISCTEGESRTISGNLSIIYLSSYTPSSFPFSTLASFRIPRRIFYVIKAIKQFKPDILHLHGHHYPINWLIGGSPLLKKIPKILTLHGMYALNPNVQGGRTIVEDIFNQTLLRWFLNRLDGIIALTPTIAKYIIKYTYKPIYIVSNGIDLDKYKANINRKYEYRDKYGLPQDKVIILFRGRFTYVKGVLEFVLAAKLLSRERNDLYFLIVGGGFLEKKIRKELRNIKNVKILPWAPLELIHELYIASDIYVLPSKWEALPITILEAMAANLVIVANDVGGVPDILNPYQYKILIKGVSPVKIKRGILKALEIVKNKSPGYISLKYVSQYDWEEISKKIYKIYRKIIFNKFHQ